MEYEKTVHLKNGEIVTMKLTEDLDEITFWQGDRKLSGEFEFIAEDDGDYRFLLARMYVPFKGCGLGEEALRFFLEGTDAIIWTRQPNGYRYDDGSYLTEDAPGFVMAMQRKGLIEEWDLYGEEEHHDFDEE